MGLNSFLSLVGRVVSNSCFSKGLKSPTSTIRTKAECPKIEGSFHFTLLPIGMAPHTFCDSTQREQRLSSIDIQGFPWFPVFFGKDEADFQVGYGSISLHGKVYHFQTISLSLYRMYVCNVM